MNATTAKPTADPTASTPVNKTNSTFAEIADVLRRHESFAVLSHVRPDGDALGSQIALGLALRQLGKKVKLWNEEGLLEKFSFLPGGELVSTPPNEPEDFDVVLALDTATRQRLGDNTLAAVGSAKVWINIDHHPSNPLYGDLVHIDPIAPATGQILFELLQSQNLPLDEAIAENLFAAISTDTGSFQYPNTTARTFEIAADILRCGIKVGPLSQQLYESYPRRRIELLRVLLDRMRFDADGGHLAPIAYFFLDRYTQSYVLQWDAFVAAVSEGKPPPVSGLDGRTPLVIGLAAKRSLDERRRVAIAEIEG